MVEQLSLQEITKAYQGLRKVVAHTGCELNEQLSKRYGAEVYLKREDLQVVRSYKIRGAFNFLSSKSDDELKNGVVCASAGNHAQGVAYSCKYLKVHATIFMPETTPKQKIRQVEKHGGDFIEVRLTGDTFDDAYSEAKKFCEREEKLFVHPFNELKVIEGQATVGIEILDDVTDPIDFLFVPVGGGGFAAGVGYYFSQVSSKTQIIGVEPSGAPAMYTSIKSGELTTLDHIDKFVDGAAVQRVGSIPFEICKTLFGEIILVEEGQICKTIIDLYNEEAIVAEPAGALTVAALEKYKDKLKGKRIVCVISGGNNDLSRMNEIQERALLYQGLKYYFIIRFPQRAGALREFLDEVLGPDDDITRFEYVKKNIRESGPALVGVELKSKDDYEPLIQRLKSKNINYTMINDDPNLFEYFV